jgi:hypothetical protein
MLHTGAGNVVSGRTLAHRAQVLGSIPATGKKTYTERYVPQ